MNELKPQTRELFHLKANDLIDAVVAVTFMCNSRCIMCNIWQYKGPTPIDAKEYLKLPSSLRMINLSGGEFFLRPDVADVVENMKIACPKAKFKISTNGFAVELTRKRMLEIMERVSKKDIAVVISIDGLEAKQLEVRRIPDGFKRNMETIKMLREIGIDDITIAFTAGDYNIDQLLNMYDLANSLKCEFTVAVLHNSDHYFQIETNKIDQLGKFREQFMKLARAELKTWSPKRWLRAYFAFGIVNYLISKKRPLPNYGGRKAMFLNPNGVVFPSDVSPKPMGNLTEHATFQELLDTDEARIAATKEADSQHWMICTSRTAIISHPIKVISWILKNKFIPGYLKSPSL
jgi:MoaA/NifB/PqqE/SkfB family radical SAM enzyme